MEGNIATSGLKATESLHHQYQELLRLLGQGNMLFDSTAGSDPSTVPDKCENSSKVVEEIIKSMKSSLKIIRKSYQLCHQERTVHGHKMLKLEELISPNFANKDKVTSTDYQVLFKKLQKKNEDLKEVIDEVRQVFGLINQLPSS